METENKVFESPDFYLCAFLFARDVELIDAIKQGGIVTFHFKRIDELEKLIIGFHSGSELVSVNRFMGAIKNLKSLKYNIKNTI